MSDDAHPLDILMALTSSIWIFYTGYLTLNRLFLSKDILWGIILFFTSTIGFYLIRYLYVFYGLRILDLKPYTEFNSAIYIKDTIYWYVNNLIYATGYFFLVRFIKREKDLRKSEAVKLRLEQEKLQLEYAFLRSQINPHTLHNIFNMLYSKSIMANVPELGDAILLVSNLMRYSLETATDENGCVLLDKEIEQINNTIKINQLRSNDNLQINFEITGDTSQAKIIPLILISLVENAFKYAELTEASYPLQLKIKVEGNSFIFYMHNKKKTVVVNETSHGIGQGNTIQRLKAAYGEDGYEMKINQDETTYTLQLTIYNLNIKPKHTTTTLAQPATA
jgi:two-component system, LytTR family, sensor kinase